MKKTTKYIGSAKASAVLDSAFSNGFGKFFEGFCPDLDDECACAKQMVVSLAKALLAKEGIKIEDICEDAEEAYAYIDRAFLNVIYEKSEDDETVPSTSEVQQAFDLIERFVSQKLGPAFESKSRFLD